MQLGGVMMNISKRDNQAVMRMIEKRDGECGQRVLRMKRAIECGQGEFSIRDFYWRMYKDCKEEMDIKAIPFIEKRDRKLFEKFGWFD